MMFLGVLAAFSTAGLAYFYGFIQPSGWVFWSALSCVAVMAVYYGMATTCCNLPQFIIAFSGFPVMVACAFFPLFFSKQDFGFWYAVGAWAVWACMFAIALAAIYGAYCAFDPGYKKEKGDGGGELDQATEDDEDGDEEKGEDESSKPEASVSRIH